MIFSYNDGSQLLDSDWTKHTISCRFCSFSLLGNASFSDYQKLRIEAINHLKQAHAKKLFQCAECKSVILASGKSSHLKTFVCETSRRANIMKEKGLCIDANLSIVLRQLELRAVELLSTKEGFDNSDYVNNEFDVAKARFQELSGHTVACTGYVPKGSKLPNTGYVNEDWFSMHAASVAALAAKDFVQVVQTWSDHPSHNPNIYNVQHQHPKEFAAHIYRWLEMPLQEQLSRIAIDELAND